MASDSRDPVTGAHIFSDTGAPDIGVDPTLVSAQANDVGTRIIRANLAALEAYPYKRAGLSGHALDTKIDYVHDGTGFVADQRVNSVAAGAVTVAATGTTTVTFPVGRFTQPPIVTALVVGHANVCVAHVGPPSATSVVVRAYTVSGAQVAGVVHWTATQMLSGSAAG